VATRRTEWQTGIRLLLQQAGVRDVRMTMTGKEHLRFSGYVEVRGGRKAPVQVVCSNSTSDYWRALHRVRGDIKRAVTQARSSQ